MKNLKWAQVVLLALLILLPKQILAYQQKVLLHEFNKQVQIYLISS